MEALNRLRTEIKDNQYHTREMIHIRSKLRMFCYLIFIGWRNQTTGKRFMREPQDFDCTLIVPPSMDLNQADGTELQNTA